jgi:uncharacterized protein with PIN domain
MIPLHTSQQICHLGFLKNILCVFKRLDWTGRYVGKIPLGKTLKVGYYTMFSGTSQAKTQKNWALHQILEKSLASNSTHKCNTPLKEVAKKEIAHLLEPLTRKYYQEFSRCPACAQLYWPGSHVKKMLALLTRDLTA